MMNGVLICVQGKTLIDTPPPRPPRLGLEGGVDLCGCRCWKQRQLFTIGFVCVCVCVCVCMCVCVCVCVCAIDVAAGTDDNTCDHHQFQMPPLAPPTPTPTPIRR